MRKKLKKRSAQSLIKPRKIEVRRGAFRLLKSPRKNIIMVGILCSLLFVGVAVTYAFIKINATARNQEANINTGSLALTFEDGTDSFQGELDFGSSAVKTFSIENTGTLEASAVMYFDNLINTYTLGLLTYTLEQKETEDGEYTEIMPSTNVPRSDESSSQVLSNLLTIPAKQKYFYKLTITLNYLNDVDQTSDLNAIFSSNFKLTKKNSTATDTITALKLKVKEGTPNFALPSTTDETKDGLYAIEDDYETSYYYRGNVYNNYVKFAGFYWRIIRINGDGTSYYFRGAVENNYVKFAGFYWRVVRINGDGSVRLAYDGTIAHANGEETNDRAALHNIAFNTNNNDAKYVGYMYGPTGTTASTSKEQAQESLENSTIKTQLDNWYKTNIDDKNYTKYLADSIFCNDRNIVSGTGYGSTSTGYAPNKRAEATSNPTPIFTCTQENDRFTVSKDRGNGALKCPVGLLSIDEVIAAGVGKYGSDNAKYYLHKGYYFWTMSADASGAASYGHINFDGASGTYAYRNDVSKQHAVVPVINIKPEYVEKMSGTGTMNDPYVIE